MKIFINLVIFFGESLAGRIEAARRADLAQVRSN